MLVSDWDLDSCILVAHWLQGSTDAPGVPGPGLFKSRMYITHHTNIVGVVTVEVVESPRSDGNGVAQSLGITLPGDVPDLAGNSNGGALVIRLEDVLNAFVPAVALPYDNGVDNNTNLAAYVSVRVPECSGAYQTFDESAADSFFGTANMTRIP